MAFSTTATAAELVRAAVDDGSPRALARLISMVEDASPLLREISRLLAPRTGRAEVIGITGAPGVGKSTTTSALVAAFRAAGRRVGVLAVDPSSPFTGGALLGDRVRMTAHATDPDVYIRSLASRGHLGGLSAATPQALRVLDAAGFDVVLIETVGVGQAEVDIAGLADTTLVLLAPGLGDGIQAAKAGILEIADVLVVNKADRPGADETYRDLVAGARNSTRGGDWRPPVIRTVATDTSGVDKLVEAIAEHRAWLVASGELTRRRVRRAADEIERLALAALRARVGDPRRGPVLDDLAARVAAGRLDPWAAADELVAPLAAGGAPRPAPGEPELAR